MRKKISPAIDLINRHNWDLFLQECPMGSIFQSHEWAFQRRLNGWEYDLITIKENEQLCSGASVYRKQIPMLRNCILDIPYGPVWKNSDNRDNKYLVDIIDKLVSYAKQMNAVFMDIDVYLSPLNTSSNASIIESVDDILIKKGFKNTDKKFGTYIVDLSRTEGIIFDSFKNNYRRDIRKAEREKVHILDNSSFETDKLMSLFYTYYSDTFNRKGLNAYPPDFFIKGIKRLVDDNLCRVFVAEFNNIIYNIAIISLFGTPTYVWGASLPMSSIPPTGQLLHWEIIRWLKNEGYSSYDLGGAPGPIPNKTDSNYGVWRFKYGFQGNYCELYAKYRYVCNNLLYIVYRRFIPHFRKLCKRLYCKNMISDSIIALDRSRLYKT